jgi:hypothetical protein
MSPVPPPQSFLQRYLEHWWAYCIPICVLLLIQILPIPYWLTGFITGLILVRNYVTNMNNGY